MILHLEASAALAFPIAIFAVEFVGEKSIGRVVLRRSRYAQIWLYLGIMTGRNFQRVARTVFSHKASALIGERRERVEVDYAAHGVATEERTLRTVNHLDATHISEVEIEVVFVKNGHIVHI